MNTEIFCFFFAEQASLAKTRVYNYKNEISKNGYTLLICMRSVWYKEDANSKNRVCFDEERTQETEKELQDTAKK